MEAQRSGIEELERIEQAITDRISYNPHLLPDTQSLSADSLLNGKRKRPFRDTALQRLEIERFLQRYEDQCKYLKASFEAARTLTNADPGHPALLRQKEIKSLGQSNASKATFDSFYKQLANIKDFHRRYPNQPVEDLRKSYAMKHVCLKEAAALGEQKADDEDLSRDVKLLSSFASDLNIDSVFSGEELYGKFLDLIVFHEKFLNFKFVNRHLSYTQYLELFYAFTERELYSPARFRYTEYFEYIADLHKYLETFYKKVFPLSAPEVTIAQIEQDFGLAWEKGEIEWLKLSSKNEDQENSHPTEGAIYCKACAKEFTNQAVYNGHLNGRKHKKNAELLERASTNGSGDLKLRAVVLHEYCIRSLAELLTKTITATKQNVERRRALTDKERRLESTAVQQEIYGEGDLSDEDEKKDENEDSDNEIIYNPLKLPLGWDGKPIPFWLYKLQGLGIEYPCEICGNYVYNGRRAFEKHFNEPRHIHGLKCLGIESGVLFKDITAIQDAVDLAEKLKADAKKQPSRETTVEMEDEEGNVMSEKVYNDLKKQGLI